MPRPAATLLRSAARVAVVVLLLAAHADAVEVTLRLVRADAPDQLVSTACTQLDVAAEQAKAKADDEAAAALAKVAGRAYVPPDRPVQPRAAFDHYCNYMRGIVIDRKHPFQRSYQGSFLGRADVIRLNLEDGPHVVDPGSHAFTVANGRVTTADPTLRANGTTLDVLAFPVTIVAVDGSAVRALPAEVRRLPVAPRLYWGDEELLPKEEHLGPETTFRRLTLYLLATGPNVSYRLSPSDTAFQVGEAGVVILDEAGRPATRSAVSVEGRYTVVLPRLAVPVTVEGDGVQVLISGPAGQLRFTSGPQTRGPQVFAMYPAARGADVTIGRRASGTPLHLAGDLGAYPRRAVVVDATAPEATEPRLLSVALPAYSAVGGQSLRARVEFRDALDAVTLAPAQVMAFLAATPVLGDDGWLNEPPPPDAPASAWRTVRVLATAEPNHYDLLLPDWPANVYRLRLGVAARGLGSPSAPLHADFLLALSGAAGGQSLSVFCPVGRHAFARGREVPISVVLKSSRPVPAGRLRLVLRRADQEHVLREQDYPARAAGEHPLHLVLGGPATAALAPGDWQLAATFGATASNPWTLHLADARYQLPFQYFDDGWGGASNVDAGAEYANVPPSLAAANAKRRLLARNAAVLGRQDTLNLSNWSVFRSFSLYQGRDSASEVAAVEMMLRQSLALPAPEVYYYQNHFELACEALAAQGMGELNCLFDGFSPRSLAHSVTTEVQAKLRQYQLTAQIAGKFDNFRGMTLVKDDTTPTGDTEVGDQGRSVRLAQQLATFVAKHGFGRVPGSEAAAYLRAWAAGPVPPPLATAGQQWETWAEDENCLLGDFYGLARQAVEPLLPGLAYPIQGPGWGGTFSGGYPLTAHRHQDPLMVQAGTGDYTMMFILDPLVRTRFFAMCEGEKWGVLGVGASPGFYNLKNHFAGYLAAGVTGFGYYNGANNEARDPRNFCHLGVQEERQNLAALIQTYGAMFRQLRPTAEIGMLYPFHQSMYEVLNVDLATGRLAGAKNAAFSGIAQLAVLGYNSEMVTADQLTAEGLRRFRVVLAPVLCYLRPPQQAALEQYAADGGTVLVGARSTLVPRGARRIADDFMECVEADDVWTFNALLDVGHAWVLSELRRKAPELGRELAPHVQPFARPTTDRVLVQTSRAGDGRCTIVWNNLFPSWLGTPRVGGNPDWSSGQGEANETTLVPLRERVAFPAGLTTYELFTQQPITGERQGDQLLTTVDLAYTPFRLFISLPQPIASLRLEAPPGVVQGTPFALRVSPLDGAGKPITASVPLHLVWRDAAGAVVEERWGASLPTFTAEYCAVVGRAPGVWPLTVTELISGRTVELAAPVAAPPAPPLAAALREVPTVDVLRPDLVRAFISKRRPEGQPVLVVLGETQEPMRPLADDLVRVLGGLGVPATVARVDQPGVFATTERVHLYANWQEMAPAQHVPWDLVLFGGEGQNALLEELQESQLLSRPLTASYPGPGRGLLTVVRSPFAFDRDVLCVLAPDEAGIRAALAVLAEPDQLPVPAAPAAPAVSALVARDLPGQVVPGTPFATMDGAPVQSVAVSPDGTRLAFGVLGYARNLFMFDAAGKLQVEDQVGHVNTPGLLLPDNTGRVLVFSDGSAYLREAAGQVRWRLRHVVAVDPALRWLAVGTNRGFVVCDPALKPLWQFDEWDQCQTTRDILFARQARFLAALDGGDTIVYRLSGKAPGLGGETGDEVRFCAALTGQEKKRIPLPVLEILRCAEVTPGPEVGITQLSFAAAGNLVTAVVSSRQDPVNVLLDAGLQPVQRERFHAPAYLGGRADPTNRCLLPDRRLILTIGDTLCIADATWQTVTSRPTANLILALVVDEARQRLIVSNYAGQVLAFDYALQPLWQADLGSAANLALLPAGRLAAGTVRGQATLLDLAGKPLWAASLNRYAEPEAVERRWAELEAAPTLPRPENEPWWEQVRQDVDLGPDVAAVHGPVSAVTPLTRTVAGSPFGTYLVEWRHRRTNGDLSLTLLITESEEAQPGAGEQRRLSLAAHPGPTEAVEHALLRLGDRPAQVQLTVRAAGDGAAETTVALRPLRFPSPNLLGIPSLYRDVISEDVRANPPVIPDLFMNVAEEGDPHITRWADPFCFVNGRMLQKEPRLLGGKWFGSGNFFLQSNEMMVPCWIDLQLPQRKVITHVVVAEDPTLPRVDTLSVEAFIESREQRSALSDFEKRQLTRGFWQTVAKKRGNTSVYNVFRLAQPVYTRHLRVYVLSGHAAVTEVEAYGALPPTVALPPPAKGGTAP